MGTNVKQLGFVPFQPVQKPAGLSLQVPDFEGPPPGLIGSRKALPSGMKVILNLMPPGVAAMNGWPLKNMVLISLGRIASAARVPLGDRPKAKMATRKSIALPGEELTTNIAQLPKSRKSIEMAVSARGHQLPRRATVAMFALAPKVEAPSMPINVSQGR